MGEVVAADGTPLPDVEIERYTLRFRVDGEAGEVEIERSFSNRIVTDAEGRFALTANRLNLSYDWSRDEYVCEDVCVAWDEVCDVAYTEEVCSTCSDEVCGDECWDESYCDEWGDCWTETWCETYCDTVTYACDCYVEDHWECWDECSGYVEECGWVTRHYTSRAPFSRVMSTQAEVRLRDGRRIAGTRVEAYRHVCSAADEESCDYEERWVQRDRFVIP